MTAGARPITGRKVLAAMVAFFALVALINGVFIWLAMDSFPGLETEDAYRRGLEYDAGDDARSQLARLGWRAEIGWREFGPGRGRLAVRLSTADGQAVAGQEVHAVMRRPVHDRSDLAVRLPETGPGIYAADVSLPGGGNWDTELRVGRKGAEKVVLRRRLVVR